MEWLKHKIMKIILTACAVGLLLGKTAYADDALSAPAKSVYDDYLKIQVSLANDSTNGIAENASAIAKEMQNKGSDLPAEVASEAEGLAKATGLTSARDAFKPLSQSLIQYLAAHNASGDYVQVFCPMAGGYWLQADRGVKNPYLGKAMSSCGEIKN
jgi:Cu(I)/Ag(I) efflux system membrane fusion protein